MAVQPYQFLEIALTHAEVRSLLEMPHKRNLWTLSKHRVGKRHTAKVEHGIYDIRPYLLHTLLPAVKWHVFYMSEGDWPNRGEGELRTGVPQAIQAVAGLLKRIYALGVVPYTRW